MRKLVSAVVAIGLLAVLPPAHGANEVEGPGWPPPSGVTWTPDAGDMLRPGGVTWNYTEMNLSAVNGLWWGPTVVELALDGAIDSPSETMTFSPEDSDLDGGVGIWTGATTIVHQPWGVVQNLETRLVLTTALVEGPEGVGTGAVHDVVGDYSANLALQVRPTSGSSWVAAGDYYDNASTAPESEGLVINVGAGFWWITNDAPEASWTHDPAEPVEGDEVTFTSTSTDDVAIVLSEWDLDGDGNFDDATGDTATRTFGSGDHTVGLRVTDDRGLIGEFTAVVHVDRCDEGPVSGLVHDVVEPGVAVDGVDLHATNCAMVSSAGL